MGKIVCVLVLSFISIIAATPALDKREDYNYDINDELSQVLLFKRSVEKIDDGDEFEEEENFTGEDTDLDIKKRSVTKCDKECGYKWRPYCGFASECEYNCEKKHDPNVRCAKPENA